MTKEHVADLYEHHHSEGKYDFLCGEEDRKDLLVRLIGSGHRILDIGCRAGNLTQYYCTGNDVVGVDVDRRSLEVCRQRLGIECHWIDIDSEPLPFPDQDFDMVIFTEVMEHLRFPQKALEEIRRVLKDSGRLIGSVPNAFRLRSRWKFLWGKPIENDPTHLHLYSRQLLYETLRAHFNRIRIFGVSGHLLGGGKYGLPVYAWLPRRIKFLFCSNLVFEVSGKS
jgi:SAM-dependent methyltransferase